MQLENRRKDDQAQVRELIETWAEAIRSKNVKAALACLTPGVITFDLAPPLHHEGREVIRKGLEDWFPTWDGPIKIEIHDLRITADSRVAYCTSLQRMSGIKRNGDKPDLWFRSTVCLQKIAGTWRIAHEHTSTPFYMDGSNRAAVDLKP